MITILGHKGSMGRRHTSILTHLGKDFAGVDILTHSAHQIEDAIARSSHVIVATPTDQHYDDILKIANINPTARILCEKPVSKSIEQVEDLSSYDITMQFQYRELVHPKDEGMSFYNYFNHGRDGIVWDCFQIIALAKGDVKIMESSPIWLCAINGRYLNLAQMDFAYISYMERWLKGYRSDWKEILDMHKKVARYESEFFKG